MKRVAHINPPLEPKITVIPGHLDKAPGIGLYHTVTLMIPIQETMECPDSLPDHQPIEFLEWVAKTAREKGCQRLMLHRSGK